MQPVNPPTPTFIIGACESIFKTYKRTCPFSAALTELIDGMLTIDPAKRLSVSTSFFLTLSLGAALLQSSPRPSPVASRSSQVASAT